MKRCWNCRAQKTACDRAQPACQNCVRNGRVCLGYGLKLSWPRLDDKRRLIRQSGSNLLPAQPQDVHFVNTSFGDVEASLNDEAMARYDQSVYRLYWFPNHSPDSISRLDPFLAANNYSPIARLLCSSADADELYGLLIRISQDDDDRLPSMATRNAITALSYQHMGLEREAIMHQTTAIRALQAAIETPEPSTRAMQMIAASMLLSIFETLNFDTSSLSWSVFFCGTKRIEKLVTNADYTYHGDEALIIDWIFYHDVMYKFSIRHWRDKNEDQIALAGEKKIISKAAFSPGRQVVVPLLGCSLELLDRLCQIIDTVLDRTNPEYRSEQHLKQLKALEFRLRNLEQHQSGALGQETADVVHQGRIAELWRLAALVYLYRVARGDPETYEALEQASVGAFEILGHVEFCERPWPIFIIALQARTEQQRSIILATLKRSLSRQPLGSMAVVSRIVHDAWIQEDLNEDEMDPLTLYGLLISRNRVPPCFT